MPGNSGVRHYEYAFREQQAAYHCHVRTRLSDLVPDRERLKELLDFEKLFPEHARSRELETLAVQYGLPWLYTVSTIEGAREYCNSQGLKSPWVTREARTFLEAAHGA
jgi:hypothetical protein